MWYSEHIAILINWLIPTICCVILLVRHLIKAGQEKKFIHSGKFHIRPIFESIAEAVSTTLLITTAVFAVGFFFFFSQDGFHNDQTAYSLNYSVSRINLFLGAGFLLLVILYVLRGVISKTLHWLQSQWKRLKRVGKKIRDKSPVDW